MRFHADLHLHSHFSRATSKNLNLEYLSKWAQIKGIRVVGTGDFVHPAWMNELEEKLEPAEEGLFRLKPAYERLTESEVPAACRASVRFMLSVEISNIYKRLGRVRKIHNVVFAPGLDAAKRIQTRLDGIGNIRADGRPILGLDSRDLLEIVLESDPLSFLIPAHIWTPWFAVLGSQGGFDRIDECFADLTPHIFAVETGLSSDPLMNWRLSQLDPYVVVSNSDAHSPPKLGREATTFGTECTYPSIYRALSDPADRGLAGTIEFFPEEGKYHYDGHRKCETRLHPQETQTHAGLCPVCNKPVTVGVMARVEALADREEGVKPPRWRPYRNLIPLPEIIGEAKKTGPESKGVEEVFHALLNRLGNEFYILMDAPEEDIRKVAGAVVAEGILRMRRGEVRIAPGYDGEYGTIRLFEGDERKTIAAQTSLFETPPDAPASADVKTLARSDMSDRKTAPMDASSIPILSSPETTPPTPALPLLDLASSDDQPTTISDQILAYPLNHVQRQAVVCVGRHLLILGGPGTGKTHTLTYRIAHTARLSDPKHILAVTFTHKAAEELKDRLSIVLGDAAGQIVTGTFHGVCLSLLRAWTQKSHIPLSFSLATPDDLFRLARALWLEDTGTQRRARLDGISRWKSTGLTEETPETVAIYTRALRKQGLLDFDDVILETLNLLRASERFRQDTRERFRHIFVDEYQDINSAQHALLLEWAGDGVLLTAIGDPNQAIYGFRGAENKYFQTFASDFPGARMLYLSENYRSAPELLNAASQMIRASDTGHAPALVATLHRQGRLTIHEAATERAEAEYVVHQIERMVGGTSLFSRDSGRVHTVADVERSFGDIAVLYRINSQRNALMEAFERSGIPFQVVGDIPLIDRPGVFEIVTLLRLSQELSVTATAGLRLLNAVVEGVGERTTAEIETLWEQRSLVTTAHFALLIDRSRALSVRAKASLQHLLADLRYLAAYLQDGGIVAALSHLSGVSCWAALNSRYGEIEDNLEKLIRCARLETQITPFLDNLLLSREYDAFGVKAERVMLMTLHASKGLEFPIVFITGCENDLLPLQYPGLTSDVEEERRLFYVGMTRAKEGLYLLRAGRRSLFGNVSNTYPSPFLADIEEQLKEYDQTSPSPNRRKQPPPSTQINLFE
ncbi:MAG: UvrD-helicase domain-containing protein [candidate division Zixibacteria bacterium]|nr:UvrD-helicase domain-containing protein [candidate division Zixibacteria bacterium]